MLRPFLSTLVVVAFLLACTAEESPAPADTTPDTDATSTDKSGTKTRGPQEDPRDEGKKIEYTLAKADEKDGEIDGVVHLCAGCALGMDGDSQHAFEMEDYELHFCSDACRSGFKEDPKAKVLALVVD